MRAVARPSEPSPSPVLWQAGGIDYRHAIDADQARLHALLACNPMDSWIRLSLERHPDYFAGEQLMGRACTVIASRADEPDAALGMYSCRHLPVHLNGRPGHAGYLGELRVAPGHRHRIRLIRDGFASIAHLVQPAWQQGHWFTSIASGNHPARRLLEAGLPGLPRYRPLGTIETLAFSTRSGRPDDRWRPATPGDITALARFYNQHAAGWQFTPVLTEHWLANLNGDNGLCLSDFHLLKDNGNICGCVAIWDQRHFKQTRVHGYRTPLANLLAPYNLWARLTRRPELPKPGEVLPAVFLAFAAFGKIDDSVIVAGVRNALAAARRKNAIVALLGLSPANPLYARLRPAFRVHRYETRIDAVDLHGTEAIALDARPPQPEVALL
jgi:hypothetical protein